MTPARVARVVEVLAELLAAGAVMRELWLCWRVARAGAASLKELRRLEAAAAAGDELALRRMLNLVRGRR